MKTEVQAILTAIDTDVTGVDTTTVDTYLPVINNDVTVTAIPFGLSLFYEPDRMTLAPPVKDAVVPLALWIKHTQGDLTTTMDNVFSLGSEVIDAIVNNDGTGYRLAVPYSLSAVTQEDIVEIGSIPYVMIVISVGLREV